MDQLGIFEELERLEGILEKSLKEGGCYKTACGQALDHILIIMTKITNNQQLKERQKLKRLWDGSSDSFRHDDS